jgi:hypothetical protein
MSSSGSMNGYWVVVWRREREESELRAAFAAQTSLVHSGSLTVVSMNAGYQLIVAPELRFPTKMNSTTLSATTTELLEISDEVHYQDRSIYGRRFR